MTLDQLKPGQKAKITRVDNEGQLAQRLMSLGLLEGTSVALLRRALGGDPIEIDVMGYALSLRRAEAQQIEIQLDR
jgi:Fe2+ transport system protein FeoA